jgi:hypothetical protein
LIFIIVTILSIAALFWGLSWYEYKGLRQKESEENRGYFSWFLSKKIRFESFKEWKKKGLEFYNRRFVKTYPIKQRWVFVCLAVSFLYLVLSGFIFALFLPGRIRGIPLMLHMIAGGVFAASLGAGVLMRARYYRFWDINRPSTRSELDRVFVRISFWVFVLSGFFLILSALSMMMPYFSLAGQIQLFSLHQYSALAAVLAAFAFIYLTPDDRLG